MRETRMNLDAAVDEIRKHLVFLKETGCAMIDLSQTSIDIIRGWGGETLELPPKKSDLPEKTDATSLSDVFDDFSKCRRCGLSEKRKVSVFGAGPQKAELMFIGFVPEDADVRTGQPYTGDEGDLLTRIISAMKLERNSVYICHAVKCLSLASRMPNKWEAKACRHHLLRQIDAIRPKVICVLGEFAASILLEQDTPIKRMRGKFYYHKGIPVMPTYDLAHLLTNPSAKRPVWEDIQKVINALSITSDPG